MFKIYCFTSTWLRYDKPASLLFRFVIRVQNILFHEYLVMWRLTIGVEFVITCLSFHVFIFITSSYTIDFFSLYLFQSCSVPFLIPNHVNHYMCGPDFLTASVSRSCLYTGTVVLKSVCPLFRRLCYDDICLHFYCIFWRLI